MGRVQLDQSGMLGFKITQPAQPKSVASARHTSLKIGSKVGDKTSPRLGAKVGEKPPVAIRLGAKIGTKDV